VWSSPKGFLSRPILYGAVDTARLQAISTAVLPASSRPGHWRFRCLVALPPAPDLLLSAKHLSVAAIVTIAPAGRSRMGTFSPEF
jgi:hypothetical protein